MSGPISLSSIKRGQPPKPPIILMYGTHGVGKTSFAASAPEPVFIQLEDGLGQIEAPTFGLLKSFGEMMEAIGSLYSEEHEFKTLVIDSIDWAEPLIWDQVCKDNGWQSIEAPGYGKGYIAAVELWRVLFEGLNALRSEKGMTIILLAHSEIRRFDSPEAEPWDRYQPKLHAKASALVQELSDCVFFVNYRVSTVKSDTGFGKKVVRAVGAGERVLYTAERPSHLAKNRYSMPDTLPLSWDAVAEFVPSLSVAQNKEI